MSCSWRVSKRLPLRLKSNERATIVGDEIVIEERSRLDVTEECTVHLVKSSKHNGYYISLQHLGKKIAVIGVDNNILDICSNMRGIYEIERAPCARISFRVFKVC